MDISNIPLFERISQRMAWLGERTRVLSQNIANADTPGYRPKDVVPLDFDAEMRRLEPVEPRRTSERHLTGTVPPAGGFDARKSKKFYEQAREENAVVIEEQMMKLSETQVTYNMMVNLYRKHIDMFKSAIGRNV
ncbi:flagellar basal-body rod protein FlgB [Dongia mobilis]|uniref:Flagellar basal body rod protein FlgB n=1 Tax=Dongia mobilis TaxID=578943 RepID=A0A4R6X1Q8_9PROT|nr:flagellar basal body protein [Dongia mobilis]TDQ84398.1 flagellar basal-body rod protein FlgB [Dongia mobilis]